MQLHAGHSGKCLNVAGASTSDGVAVVQYRCSSRPQEGVLFLNELWQMTVTTTTGDGTPIFQLRAGHSGKCLNVGGRSPADGAKVYQFRCVTIATPPGAPPDLRALNELWYTHD